MRDEITSQTRVSKLQAWRPRVHRSSSRPDQLLNWLSVLAEVILAPCACSSMKSKLIVKNTNISAAVRISQFYLYSPKPQINNFSSNNLYKLVWKSILKFLIWWVKAPQKKTVNRGTKKRESSGRATDKQSFKIIFSATFNKLYQLFSYHCVLDLITSIRPRKALLYLALFHSAQW